MTVGRWTMGALLACLLLAACGGGNGESDPCSECLPDQRCDEDTGVCVESGPASLEGTDLAPRLAGTWNDGEPVVMVFDRIGQRFLFGTGQPGQESWETAALSDEAIPPPGGPHIVLVSLSAQPAFLAETAPGELSLLRRSSDGWERFPAGELPGPLTGLAAVPETGQGFHVCAGDVQGTLWSAEGSGDQVTWNPVDAEFPEGTPAAPCAMGSPGGQPVLVAALRPAGLVSLWQDQDDSWQLDVLDAAARPVALAVAPSEKGLAAAWVDGVTGELRMARGEGGGIEVVTAAAASPESAAACTISLATSPNGLMRLAFRNADTRQFVLLGPQPSGPGFEPLGSVSQDLPLVPLLGFSSIGESLAVGVEHPEPGKPGAGSYRKIDFSSPSL